MSDWAALAKGRYLNLESFKRDGTGVRTPLWFAADGDRTVFVYSETESFKIKRLRRNGECRVASCDMRGKVLGPWIAARAEIVEGAAAARGMALLDRKYWPWKQMLGVMAFLGRRGARTVVAIRPAGS